PKTTGLSGSVIDPSLHHLFCEGSDLRLTCIRHHLSFFWGGGGRRRRRRLTFSCLVDIVGGSTRKTSRTSVSLLRAHCWRERLRGGQKNPVDCRVMDDNIYQKAESSHGLHGVREIVYFSWLGRQQGCCHMQVKRNANLSQAHT